MTKRFVIALFLSISIMLNENAQGKPQDVNEAAILAVAQVKDTIDNGAAANDKKEFEFFGAKIKNDMEIGFGDAIRSKRSGNKRLVVPEISSRSIESLNMKRDKRSANFLDFAGQISNSKEVPRPKRQTSDNSIAVGNSDEDYDSDYDYASSAESDENERRKRSMAYEKFVDVFFH